MSVESETINAFKMLTPTHKLKFCGSKTKEMSQRNKTDIIITAFPHTGGYNFADHGVIEASHHAGLKINAIVDRRKLQHKALSAWQLLCVIAAT